MNKPITSKEVNSIIKNLPTPKVNPSVSYVHWIIKMCQRRFTGCKKCITFVRDASSQGLGERGAGYMGTVLSAQFCCGPKTALKNRVY